MSRYLSNRDGGKSGEQALTQFIGAAFNGQVATGMGVTQQGTPVMGVSVDAGTAAIPSGNGYPYVVWSTVPENVTLNTADGSNPRIDLIIAYVDLSVVSSTNSNNPNAWSFLKVTGTPSGSPVVPNAAAIQAALPNSSYPYIILAQVAVAAGATTITNSNITGLRQLMSPTAFSSSLRSGLIITDEYTASTIVTDLATVGPSAQVNVGQSGMVLAVMSAAIYNISVGQFSYMYLTSTGANFVNPNATNLLLNKSSAANSDIRASYVGILSGLNPGLTTFLARYAVGGGTGHFYTRELTVMPL